jgi:hypothetical protein
MELLFVGVLPAAGKQIGRFVATSQAILSNWLIEIALSVAGS